MKLIVSEEEIRELVAEYILEEFGVCIKTEDLIVTYGNKEFSGYEIEIY